MKNAKYFTEGQNVYVKYTGGGSRVTTELICIATSEQNAWIIAHTLNPKPQATTIAELEQQGKIPTV
jgi:hypothetical protein